jgi:hypothetical protein
MAAIIPQRIFEAMMYIIALDDLQTSPGITPGTFKWQSWHWTQEESEFWTSLRNVVEPLRDPYVQKTTISGAQRDKVKLAIRSAREYSSFDVSGHRLLLKIAGFGDSHAWEIANVKFGTPRAKKAHGGKSDSTAMKQPSLTIRENILHQQLLIVLDPDAPKSKKLPDGMKFAKIYRYVGKEPPANIHQYEFIGNSYRGRFVSHFSEMGLSGDEKIYAYYIARYESKKGELGMPCAMVSAEILF